MQLLSMITQLTGSSHGGGHEAGNTVTGEMKCGMRGGRMAAKAGLDTASVAILPLRRPSQLCDQCRGEWRKEMSHRHRTYLGGVGGMRDGGARVRQGAVRATAAWTQTIGHLPVPLSRSRPRAQTRVQPGQRGSVCVHVCVRVRAHVCPSPTEVGSSLKDTYWTALCGPQWWG